MNNDNNQSNFFSSTTFAIRPHNYYFDKGHAKNKLTSARFDKSVVMKIRPLREQIHWKPKIPSKRLFEEPKFLLSMERKKIRVINGLKDSDFEAPEVQRKKFKSQRIRVRKEIVAKNENQLYEECQPEGQYIHSSLNKLQKNNKIPLVNFNLQHLIRQKKSFKEEQGARKKGNNDPYYSFFSSQRFEFTSRPKEQKSLIFPRPRTQIKMVSSKQRAPQASAC